MVRAGAVLNVATGELFTATTGGGAWLTAPGPPRAGAADRQPAGLARADAGRHRVRLPGRAATGAGRGRGARCCPGSATSAGTAARRWTCARRRPGGSTPTTSCTSTRGTTRPARWSPPRPGWWSPGCRAGRSPSPMAIAAAPSVAGPWPCCELLAELRPAALSGGGASAGGGGAGRGAERRGDLLRRGQAVGPDELRAEDEVDLRGGAGVGVVAGARAGPAPRRRAASDPRGPCRTSPAPVTSRPLPSLPISATVNPRRCSSPATGAAMPGLVGGVEHADGHRASGPATAAPPAAVAHAAASSALRSSSCRKHVPPDGGGAPARGRAGRSAAGSAAGHCGRAPGGGRCAGHGRAVLRARARGR